MKQYNVRLDPSVVKKLDSMPEGRSQAIRNAISLYMQGDTQNVYDTNMVDFLKGQVTYLQRMNSYLSLPFYKRWIMDVPLLENKLK